EDGLALGRAAVEGGQSLEALEEREPFVPEPQVLARDVDREPGDSGQVARRLHERERFGEAAPDSGRAGGGLLPGPSEEVVEAHVSPPARSLPRAASRGKIGAMSDQDLRALERRVALEPTDERARFAFGLALGRAGRVVEALAFLGGDRGAGYGLLARAA